jgi:hypothetical protein
MSLPRRTCAGSAIRENCSESSPYAALTYIVSSYRTSFYVHLRHTCLSARKGLFQTFVKQKPEFLHFALFPFKTKENGLKSGIKV